MELADFVQGLTYNSQILEELNSPIKALGSSWKPFEVPASLTLLLQPWSHFHLVKIHKPARPGPKYKSESPFAIRILNKNILF